MRWRRLSPSGDNQVWADRPLWFPDAGLSAVSRDAGGSLPEFAAPDVSDVLADEAVRGSPVPDGRFVAYIHVQQV